MRTESRELLAVGIFGNESRIGDRIEILMRRGRAFSPRASTTGVIASAIALFGLMVVGSFAPRWIAFAQPALPSFEVASIKPTEPDSLARGIRPYPGGRVVAQGATLKFLIQWAYQVQEFQISGTTGWMNSDRYDIEAKAPVGLNPSDGQLRVMFRTLLAERFKLAVHRESKPFDTYAVTVAKGGPKLRPADDANCVPPPAGQCGGIRVSPAGLMYAVQSSMSVLAINLSFVLERPVVDETGLTGTYAFKMEWTPDRAVSRVPGEAPVFDSNLPSLFTALQEQLGLKLEARKGTAEVIVVDHAEKAPVNAN